MNISNLNYEQLLLLADSNRFYEIVDSKEKAIQYINALHHAYCKENNIKQTKIIFTNDFENNAYACYNPAHKKVFMNSKIIDLFNIMKDENNTYYPFILVMVTIHETRHLWQYQNINKMFSNDTSNREKLTLYALHKKLHEAKNMRNVKISPNAKTIKIKDLLKVTKNFFTIKEMEMEYGNSPIEFDAEEEVMKAFMFIYDTTLSEMSLNVLLNYANKINKNDGLWFLDHEYYEDLENPYSQRSFKVIRELFVDCRKKELEAIKNKNHGYCSEEYTLDLYPTISKTIHLINQNQNEVPEIGTDYDNFANYFFNTTKSLPKRK